MADREESIYYQGNQNFDFKLKKSLEARKNALYKRIIQPQIGKPELIKGCSEQEIEELEKACGLSLPLSYKVLLRNFGHGFGGIAYDVEFLYQDVFPLTQIAREMLQYEGDPVLPENTFVFAMRYREQFAFFEVKKGIEDPPIFFYMEEDENFTKTDDSIFGFWEAEIKLKEQLVARRRERNTKQS